VGDFLHNYYYTQISRVIKTLGLVKLSDNHMIGVSFNYNVYLTSSN